MTAKETWSSIRADAKTYQDWRFQAGFWVTLSYRVRRYRKFGPTVARLWLPLDILLGLVRRLVSDSIIPSACVVGPGLCLPHATGVIINHLAIIGSRVRIFQQVTIGEWQRAAPVIGDGCSIYSGAKVFGGIDIGEHARIGPNSVVDRDIPAFCNVRVVEPAISVRKRNEGKDRLLFE